MATATKRRRQGEQREWVNTDGMLSPRVAKGSRPALVRVGDTVCDDDFESYVVTHITPAHCVGEDENGVEVAMPWGDVRIAYCRPAM